MGTYSITTMRDQIFNGMKNDLPDSEIADFVTTSHLVGGRDEFHNVASDLARLRRYQLACLVVEAGLKLYPHDTDLLANYLSFGVKSGNDEKANGYYSELARLPKELYTWRSFTFTIDYLLHCYSQEKEEDERKKIKESVQKVLALYKERFPKEERAYIAEFEVGEAFGATDEELLGILKNGIAVIAVSPQCCLKFVDRSLELGNYDDAIRYAPKGLSASAQDQESVDTGYFYYAMALAMDAKWYDPECKDAKGDDYAQQILKNYRAADVSLDSNKTTYRKLLRKRSNMIATEIGTDLPYPIAESTDELMSILRSVSE